MKKENIYKLVELGYKGGDEYNSYITQFIKNLNDEKYFEMANYIQELQFKNSKAAFMSKERKSFKSKRKTFVFPENVDKKTKLIINGFKKNLIKKILLVGRPGTGKTTYVENLVNEMNLPLLNIKISDILDYKYGESIKKLETLMNEYRNSECIIFFDEADSLFRKRGTINDIYETDRLVSTMLKELDKESKSLIVFASNLYNEIDKAIIRRMDEIIDFNHYTYDSLIRIWDYYSNFYKIKQIFNTLQLENFINDKQNILTPSDLKNIAKKIAILLLDQNKEDSKVLINEILKDYFNHRNEGVINE